MIADDELDRLGSLYEDQATWEAYDGEDQDLRRARWTAVVAAWALGRDEVVSKMLDPMGLPELIDLDASLTSLRDEVRKVIARSALPAPKRDLD